MYICSIFRLALLIYHIVYYFFKLFYLSFTVEQPAPVVHYEIQQADTIHPIRTIARDEPLGRYRFS